MSSIACLLDKCSIVILIIATFLISCSIFSIAKEDEHFFPNCNKML